MNYQRHSRQEKDFAGGTRPRRMTPPQTMTGGSEISPYAKWASIGFIILVLICSMIFSYKRGVRDSEGLTVAEPEKKVKASNGDKESRNNKKGNSNNKKYKKN